MLSISGFCYHLFLQSSLLWEVRGQGENSWSWWRLTPAQENPVGCLCCTSYTFSSLIFQNCFHIFASNIKHNHMYQEQINIFIRDVFTQNPLNLHDQKKKKSMFLLTLKPRNPESIIILTGCVGRSWISAATREPRRNVGSKTLVVFLFYRNFRPGNKTCLSAKTVLVARSLEFNVSSKILTNSGKKQVIEMLEWNT